MDEFISIFNSIVVDVQRQPHHLLAYTLFGAIYSTFKEMVKTSFYNPRDQRFPAGAWQIVEWLMEDFTFIESLEAKWRKTSALLSFEALLVFENIDVHSALDASLLKIKSRPSWIIFSCHNKDTPVPKTLIERWIARLSLLPLQNE